MPLIYGVLRIEFGGPLCTKNPGPIFVSSPPLGDEPIWENIQGRFFTPHPSLSAEHLKSHALPLMSYIIRQRSAAWSRTYEKNTHAHCLVHCQ